jgi:hypothetical protein
VYAAWVAGSDRKASEMLRAADGIALRILQADSADGRAGHRNWRGAAPSLCCPTLRAELHWAERVNQRDALNQPIVWLLDGRDVKAALPRASNERECR